MTTVIKCHSLSYVIFNAKMTSHQLNTRVVRLGSVMARLKECEASDIFWHLPSFLVVQLVRDIETAAAIHGSGAISAGSVTMKTLRS